VRDVGRRGRANSGLISTPKRLRGSIRAESAFTGFTFKFHKHCAATIARSNLSFPERTNSVVYQRDRGVSSAFCGDSDSQLLDPDSESPVSRL
jgi:hypothetical protein